MMAAHVLRPAMADILRLVIVTIAQHGGSRALSGRSDEAEAGRLPDALTRSSRYAAMPNLGCGAICTTSVPIK